MKVDFIKSEIAFRMMLKETHTESESGGVKIDLNFPLMRCQTFLSILSPFRHKEAAK
jgi:hypothetical protein